MVSTSLHCTAFGIIVAFIVIAPPPVETEAPQIQVDGRWGVLQPDSDTTELRSADSDEKWTDVIRSSREQRSLADPSTSDLSSFVQRQMDQSVEDGKRRDSKENEDKLSRLGRRLAETSKEKNVDDMAEFLGGLTGNRRQEAPSDGVLRPFDVATAQIDRVRKDEDSEGNIHYIATLIDENGTTIDMELDSESGPQLYRTMKIIEANPLLKSVYRKIVMGFLDQMLSKPTTK